MKRTISMIVTALAFAAFLSACTGFNEDGEQLTIYQMTDYLLFDEYKIGGPDG